MSEKVDEVTYNGITYRRYPDSENRPDRKYYRPSANHIEDGVEALHREVYKNEVGDIPDGCVVHHKDGDPTNNDPSNLEAIPPEEHAKRHDWGGDAPPEKAIEKAKEWHKSEEGREWHALHFEESLAQAFDETAKTCEYCGDGFTDESAQDAGKYCSNKCKSAARRERGDDDVTRECVICGEQFTTNKYKETKTCDASCAAKFRWQRK